MNHPYDDPAWKQYAEHFLTSTLPGMKESATTIYLNSGPADADTFDVQEATELGAMMILDKPIIVISPVGRSIPPKIRKVADLIIEDFDHENPEQMQQVQQKLRDHVEGLGFRAVEENDAPRT